MTSESRTCKVQSSKKICQSDGYLSNTNEPPPIILSTL